MTLEAISQVVTIFGFPIGALAVVFAAFSVRAQTKSADTATFLQFVRESSDSEQKLREAALTQDNDYRRFLFIEHMNFLEAASKLYLCKSVGRHSREAYRDFLINHLAAFRLSEFAANLLRTSVTDETTYNNLRIFYHKNRSTIEKKTEMFKELQSTKIHPAL